MHISRPGLRAGWLILLIATLGMASLVHAQDMSGEALVQALRKGGYVLLMRHASSPHTPPEKGTADPANTALERQLDDKGRATATAMGQAIKRLDIPVGAVLSSPTFRARETARLAGFGTPRVHEELGDGGRSMSPQAVAAWTSWLKKKVAEKPKAGRNTIIITHMPNIAAAFPEAAHGLSDGETLVLQPDGAGSARLLGHIEISDWPKLGREQ